MSLDFLKNKVWQVDGITVTVGVVLLIIVIGFLIMRARG
jgi:UPF0716 family protein affecting phage T7 exclusion